MENIKAKWRHSSQLSPIHTDYTSICNSPFFFFNDTATTEIYTLSHTTLFRSRPPRARCAPPARRRRGRSRPCRRGRGTRSEEHTSELQSRGHLVCRLLLEKKKKTNITTLHAKKTKKTNNKK